MVKKVAIIGAGPSGLLLAHYLLRRGDKYQIDIYERRSDPRIVSFSKSRTYPISLNERGMSALRKIEGLEEAVKAISVEMRGRIFHQKNVLRESLANILHQIFPKRFPPSISELVFETTVPYSEILNSYKGWISKVKKSNEKLSANL